MSDIINRVDPDLLKQQRNDLLNIIEEHHKSEDELDIDLVERLDGLINLLDLILDSVEDTEEEFNPRWIDPYENIGLHREER